MFKLSLKNIWSRKGRLVLTALAVIAGTAFLSGVFVFTDTIKGSFNSLFADAYSKTDAYVRSSDVLEGDFGEDIRASIDASLLDVVAAVPGVKAAQADVSGTATITNAEGTIVGGDGPPQFGRAWHDGVPSPWTLKEGVGATTDTEVVIDAATAKKGDIKVGDTVSITTKNATREFTVVGLALFAGQDGANSSTFALFDLPTAQEFVLGEPGKVDFISVAGDGSLSEAELSAAIQSAIGSNKIEVLTGKEITKESQSQAATSLNFLTVFLSIFALIALFVGSFVIYNVFSISAAQRERENALLRAIGASRAQVTRSLFVEALVVGIGGSLLGCLGGVGLATAILGGLNAAGFGPGQTNLVINASPFIITIVVGTVVTLICAVAPAIRSGRVPPLAAMRDVAVDRAAVSTVRKVIGGVALVVGVVAVALGLKGGAAEWLGLGVAGFYVALIALGPFVASPISRAATPLLASTRGAAGTMAGRNAARNPKRTAITAGAVAVGLSLIIGVATLGSSAKASIRETIGKSFIGDYIVSPKQQGNGTGGLPVELVDKVENAGVGDVLSVGASFGRIGDATDGTLLVAIDPADAETLFTFDFTSGGFTDLTANGILLKDDQAKSLGVSMGDSVSITLIGQPATPLVVQGIYTTSGFTDVLVDRDLFAATPTLLQYVQIYVKGADGETGATRATLDSIVDQFPTTQVQSRNGFIDAQSSQIDGFLNFLYALLGMSVFIAIIGVAITLWLAVWERRREIGLLRAVGMTKRQVRSSVLWESLITGVVGVVMGVVLGTVLGWIIVKAFEDDGLGVFQLPISTILVAAGVLFALSGLAALIPGRKGSNANMLEAIATT
jgi:putative ABC transport system permease protein